MNKNLIIPAVPNQDSQDMDDLRIVEYLNLATLPEPLQKMLSQATTPAEQDMLLMATLTATSACTRTATFRVCYRLSSATRRRLTDVTSKQLLPPNPSAAW